VAAGFGSAPIHCAPAWLRGNIRPETIGDAASVAQAMSVVGVTSRVGRKTSLLKLTYKRPVIGTRLMRTSPDKTITPFEQYTRDQTASWIIDPASAELFIRQYNRMSFRFGHNLRGHPLLDISNLVKLSAGYPDDSAHAYWCNGRVEVSDSWDAGRQKCLSLQQTVAGIANDDSLVILKHVEEDSELGPLVRECIATVVDMVGPQMRDDVIVARGTLLIASPHHLTNSSSAVTSRTGSCRSMTGAFARQLRVAVPAEAVKCRLARPGQVRALTAMAVNAASDAGVIHEVVVTCDAVDRCMAVVRKINCNGARTGGGFQQESAGKRCWQQRNEHDGADMGRTPQPVLTRAGGGAGLARFRS
jgi:hypothetical protein